VNVVDSLAEIHSNNVGIRAGENMGRGIYDLSLSLSY